MTELHKTPRWKQAVDDFLADFGYGDLISHAWLERRFGMPSIDDRQRLTSEQFRERQFEWLANVESFKAALLKEHQVCLQTVRGHGYRWVPPHEQTTFAMREFDGGAKKLLRTTGHKLRNLRHLELTDDQRRTNVDAITKLATLTGMATQALR